MTYGLLYAPLAHQWYLLLYKMQTVGLLKRLPKRWSVSTMIFFDQTLFSMITNYWFYIHVGLMEEGTLESGVEMNRLKFWPTMYFNWAVWPFAQLINFFYVPVHYRVLYDNLVTFWWNIGLSYLAFVWEISFS